jgi:hypothetical protein
MKRDLGQTLGSLTVLKGRGGFGLSATLFYKDKNT